MDCESIGFLFSIMIFLVLLTVVVVLNQLGISLWIAFPAVFGTAFLLVFMWMRKIDKQDDRKRERRKQLESLLIKYHHMDEDYKKSEQGKKDKEQLESDISAFVSDSFRN